MKKKIVIAGNWKMNKTVSESVSFVEELNIQLSNKKDIWKISSAELIIFPPFTSLYTLKGRSPYIYTGAQNMFHKENGAYTGEISPLMVKETAKFVLIGHSERREIFGEKDEDINLKLKAALDIGLKPVLCIGETLEERESKKTFEKIERQLKDDLEGIDPDKINNIYVAYEPIWAIGTGKTATPELAQEVHGFITQKMSGFTGSEYTQPILYGGSVKPENCKKLLEQENINGLLIGGASLKVESFFDIIQNSLELVE